MHKVVELIQHDYKCYHRGILDKVAAENQFNQPHEIALIERAIREYFSMIFDPTNRFPRLVKAEIRFESGLVKGFLDSVWSDDRGNWIIADLKTRGMKVKPMPELAKELQYDQQLCLYSHNRFQIVEGLGLNPELFCGIILHEVEISRLKQGKNDTSEMFAARIQADRDCSHRATFVDHKTLRIAEVMKNFDEAASRAHILQQRVQTEGLECATKNTQSCNAFHSKCEFYSKCYGDTQPELPSFGDLL
jgi:hypothetical protein